MLEAELARVAELERSFRREVDPGETDGLHGHPGMDLNEWWSYNGERIGRAHTALYQGIIEATEAALERLEEDSETVEIARVADILRAKSHDELHHQPPTLAAEVAARHLQFYARHVFDDAGLIPRLMREEEVMYIEPRHVEMQHYGEGLVMDLAAASTMLQTHLDSPPLFDSTREGCIQMLDWHQSIIGHGTGTRRALTRELVDVQSVYRRYSSR